VKSIGIGKSVASAHRPLVLLPLVTSDHLFGQNSENRIFPQLLNKTVFVERIGKQAGLVLEVLHA
jgi:hypothetical protein